MCYSYIYGYKYRNLLNISADEELALINLKSNKDIVISRPDKGNGVFVMNRTDYITKLHNVIGDTSKFVKLNEDPTAKRESSLQSYLYRLKAKGHLEKDVYEKLRPTGSRPAGLYGLPKTHKKDVPLRPIVSCIGSYTYNLAKFLVTILQPLCSNTYTVKDSFSFASDINGMSNVPFMCSFDISSLFTSIPLDETIGYCLDKLFTDCDTVRGLNRKQLHRLLCFSAKESHFLFDGAIYDQVDGVAMGSPLGPVLANIFMCKLEEQAITNFPGNRPIVYKRYVDDTFLVFENQADMEVFFQWINQQHSQIKFTCEKEENGTLPFLDVLVQRTTDGSLCTSIYRKPTFSGLYLRWDSFVPKTFKKGLVNGLLCRAWRLSFQLYLISLRSAMHKRDPEI